MEDNKKNESTNDSQDISKRKETRKLKPASGVYKNPERIKKIFIQNDGEDNKPTDRVLIDKEDDFPVHDLEVPLLLQKPIESDSLEKEFFNSQTNFKEEDNKEEQVVDMGNYDSPFDEFQEPKSKKKLNLVKLAIISLLSLILLMIIILILVWFPSGNDNKTEEVLNNVEKSIGEETSEVAEDKVVGKAREIVENAKSQTTGINLPSIPSNDVGQIKETFTYLNEFHNVSFEHPDDWSEIYSFALKETPKGVHNVVMLGYPPESKKVNNVRISVEETPVSITSKEYIRQTEDRMKEIFPHFQSIDTGEITVSGREAPTRMYLWVPQSELDKSQYSQEWTRMQQYQVYVAGHTKVYIVTFTSTDKEFSKNYSTYEKLLKSLRLGD